jgi:hypothetical protein
VRVPGILAVVVALAGCTTIGADTAERKRVDFGQPLSLEVCLLKHKDVSQPRADLFIAAVNKEFADFGIAVTVPWVREWERPAFTVNGIMQDILTRDLEAPCDRLIALVDRHAGDFLWGLLLPEVLGAVDDVTHTRGYIVANFGSLNQAFSSVEMTAVHEFYHLVGCGHGISKSKCYHDIAGLKAGLPPESDFMPGVGKDGEYLLTREAANKVVREYLAEQAASKAAPAR